VTTRRRSGREGSVRALGGGQARRTRHRWLGLAAAVGLVGLPALPASAGSDAATRPDAAGDRGDLQPADVTATESTPRNTQLRVFGTGDAPETYLIRLADPAVPSYEGGEPGLAPTTPAPGGRLDPDAEPVRAYRDFLVEEQVGFVQRMERTTGREIEVPFTYQYAVNGIAAVLTADEARAIADDPAVVSISPDKVRELHTDVGPQWEGAEALWNAVVDLGLPTDIKGEGVVIGTIDTGISPGNRSFAATGDDGYTVQNPLGEGNYLGACDPTNATQYDPLFPCNSKLIGAYVFGGINETAVDYDGHGSHTASTSGGNVVNDVVVQSPTLETPPFDISGVAPHANVISYLGCCNLSGLTASINQAIADGVDVINYSIGSPDPSAAWDDFDTVGFLNARAAGIFVATSNGNDGPGFATTGSPADAPWLTSVGASTHPRHNGNALTGLTSSTGALADIPGKSVTGALTTPTPIVYAGAFGDPFCETTTGNETNFGGRIVICDRGVNGRVEKSQNVAAQGAVGFVLTNDEIHGDSLLGDEYALPGVFINYTDGQALKTWLTSGADHVATIAGTTFTVDTQYADIMASFSSRGPNRAIDTITPSVTAPGVDILAALGDDTYESDIHGFISGTSMSSPHVAGAGALLTQARPDWTPAEQQSALMTTARPTVLNHDGELATPYAQGSGHVDVGAAVQAGLLFDESIANYLAANPAEGGDPKTLNLPSFADSQCLATCSWQRTATVPDDADAPVPAGVTWTASTTADTGLVLDVELSQATVSPGDSMGITVTADVTAGTIDETLFGRITLTPSDASVPTVTMPVAVVPSAGVLPGEADITTRRNAGSYPLTGIQSLEVTEFTGSVLGLVPASKHEGTLEVDPTNGAPYDDLSQVDVYTVEVPDGASRLVAEVLAWTMPDLDLYVGTGDTPSAATQVCSSASSGSAEMCDVTAPAAGTWWILVQNWEASDAPPDTYTLATAVVPGEALGNAGIDGPDGPVPVGQPYDVRLHWDVPEMVAGDVWYGTAVLGTAPETPDNIGSFPVTIRRTADDVTKTASVTEATVGEPITYDITVQPNVTPEDLTYTIVDTVPDGLTVDPASITGGGVVDGQTITWTVPMPTGFGKVGDYIASTPATNPQCAEWGGFLDLASVGIPLNATLDGDTVAANVFANLGPFEQYGGQFPNLTVSEDGLITVAGGYGGEPWTPQAIPAAAAPNGVIAPLWADLELSVADGRGMRLATSSGVGAAVVQWDDPFEFGEDPTDLTNSLGTFQAWVYNTVSDVRPEITFEYGEVGALPAMATIGIENILGDRATALVGAGDPAPVIGEGGTICLDYQGFVLEPVTVSYTVTVDDDAQTGTATNAAVHVTDDPYAQPVTASVDVAITGNEPLPCTAVISGFRPGAVKVTSGITCLQNATVFGHVTVSPGAGVRASGSALVGGIDAKGATEVTVCGSLVLGTLRSKDAAAVTIGDPANGCPGNIVLGAIQVTGTSGPTVIGGNGILGKLACTGNDPAPTNGGSRNTVLGKKSGQCAKL
jgi:uncharacterized repeat protein (TIGR01451 family)